MTKPTMVHGRPTICVMDNVPIHKKDITDYGLLRDRYPNGPPKPPETLHTGVVDRGAERWRFVDGALAAYFLYCPKGHSNYPWAGVWLAPWYKG